jgi:hypothetical protein
VTPLKFRYREAPKIFDLDQRRNPYFHFEPTMREEVLAWLTNTMGKSASDMTDLTWGKARWYHRVDFHNVRGRGKTGGWVKEPCGHEFIFKNPEDATLFKLAWGGRGS